MGFYGYNKNVEFRQFLYCQSSGFFKALQLSCKVLKKLEEPNVKSKVIKSVGESPKQYPEYDEEDWDEDDDLDPKIFEQ